MVLSLKARVHNGRLVLDEPTDLPEGHEVELYAEPFEASERAAIDAALVEALDEDGEDQEAELVLATLRRAEDRA